MLVFLQIVIAVACFIITGLLGFISKEVLDQKLILARLQDAVFPNNGKSIPDKMADLHDAAIHNGDTITSVNEKTNALKESLDDHIVESRQYIRSLRQKGIIK